MRTDDIPTCAANQFLTYNGSSFQCAATQTMTLPECSADQVVTVRGGQFICMDAPGAGAGSIVGGLTFDHNNGSCLSSWGGATCSRFTPSCPVGSGLVQTSEAEYILGSDGGWNGYTSNVIYLCVTGVSNDACPSKNSIYTYVANCDKFR